MPFGFPAMYSKRLDKGKVGVEQGPRVVGLPRNVFGTRLCQRIECSRCHKTDYVSMRISGAKTKYCRSCAEKMLSTFEAGRIIAEKQVQRQCIQCQCEFYINETVANKKEELQCKDCLRGFEVWRGKLRRPVDEQEDKKLIIKSGSKTVIRKNNT